MNCPSRTDEPAADQGWNQNPPELAADVTTRQDLNGIANLRTGQDSVKEAKETCGDSQLDGADDYRPKADPEDKSSIRLRKGASTSSQNLSPFPELPPANTHGGTQPSDACPPFANLSSKRRSSQFVLRLWSIIAKYCKFIGPGFMISVAYIDPGNYSTDVAAGAATKYKLLFIVLLSNIFAIVLQSLAVRLGTVTGLNLAQHCRAHLPRWLNIFLYIVGECAIVATDIAEVTGSAIAINLLIKVPLVWGCLITIVDVLIILIFYSPNGSTRRLRAFEYFVMILVLGVVICFCIQLSYIRDASVGQVFDGFVPSSAVLNGQGIYLSCGILGATVMPHSLYLGSGLVQPRLIDFDIVAGNYRGTQATDRNNKNLYRPSLAAIRSCLSYSTAEVIISLFTFALFVNSAILIVAGASLSTSSAAENGNLFGIHDLLSTTLAPIAGTIFALALLLSGTSAGIICTIAGQMLSEGALQWKTAPWKRRLLTRSISIVPSIVVAGAVGKEGLSAALNGTQFALSIALPFVSAPLIYFTCRNKYMVVGGMESLEGEEGALETEQEAGKVRMRNHRLVSALAIAIWFAVTIMDVASLVFAGLGKT
ncbi:transporter protein smf2 [Usnea florida]